MQQRVRLSAGPAAKANASSAPPKVDREARIIRDVIVAGEGVAEGHGFELDATSLRMLESLSGRNARGIKSRLSHPTACLDAMGSYLGRLKDWRQQGDTTRADLHLDPTAFTSPKGDLGTYVMDLAESDPEAFGVSVVVMAKTEDAKHADGTFRLGADGKPVKVMRPFRLGAADVVDSPATGRSFLSDDNASQASAILDRLLASGQSPEQLRTRLNTYLDSFLALKGLPMTTATPPAPVPVPAPAPAPVLDEVQLAAVRTEAVATERKRISDIQALCSRAGEASLAQKMIDENVSLSAAKAMLLESMLSKGRVLGPDSAKPPEEQLPAKPDADAKYKAEFAAHKASLGMTEADYIAMRRVDDGLDTLASHAE